MHRYFKQITASQLRSTALAALLLAAPLSPALAQHYTGQLSEDRLRRLEQDVNLLQQQLYQRPPGSNAGPAALSALTPSAGAASAEVRLVQLEEKMRDLNGRIEELQHAIEQLRRSLDVKEKDLSFRIQQLEGGSNVADTGAPTPAYVSSPVALPPGAALQQGAAQQANDLSPAAGEEAQEIAALPSATQEDGGTPRNLTQPGADNSREAYNQAFQLLNQARFPEAREALQAFIERYPADPLRGNAHYWLGETFYVERDYLKAADTFRQGFEVAKDGPKAPDNLLKLGMSMAAMGKNTEACVIYKQLDSRYGDAGASIKQKVTQEQNRLDCQ